MDIKNIYYLAGLLEGEGYFGLNNFSPVIVLKMNDLDTIEKFKNLTKTTDTKIYVEKRDHLSNSKDSYVAKIYGDLAIQWMLTLYSLMSLRRKSKIREVFLHWKQRKSDRAQLLAQDRLVKQIMKTGHSKEEAEKLFLESLVKDN